MKKVTLFVLCCVAAANSFAQEIPREQLEDSLIGWKTIYNFKGAKETKKVDHRNYSIAQLSIIDTLANWMQASYVPKGGLGDISKIVSPTLNAYNWYTESLPQHYGAYAKTYYFLKRDNKGKLTPATSHSVTWSAICNGVPTSWVIRELCSPTEFYFTLPSFESDHDIEITKATHDLSNEPHVSPYINFWLKSVETGGGSNMVILSKNNRSPFIKLTKGEFLKAVETSLPRMYEKEKKTLIEANGGHADRAAPFVKLMDEKYARFGAGLIKVKEKYKDRLDEIALVSPQPSIYDLETGRDLFSSGYLTDRESLSGRVPVYKIDPEMAALCKTDKPQWILISWWWASHDALEKHLHESILNNFNWPYVYNFFFDPAKVKGQPYRPLGNPGFKEAPVVAKQSSDASKKASSDNGVFFFEDFSSSTVGQKPVGWRCPLADGGRTATVTKVDGLDGNWVTGGYQLESKDIKQPFPIDFTVSYDLVCSKNFTWGAKSLVFRLAKEQPYGNVIKSLTIRMRPGYDGREGEAIIDGKFSKSDYDNNYKWFPAPGFSNNKEINKISVMLKKKGDRIQLFLDGNKVADYDKVMIPDLQFNTLAFLANGNDMTKDRYYISNIKMTRD